MGTAFPCVLLHFDHRGRCIDGADFLEPVSGLCVIDINYITEVVCVRIFLSISQSLFVAVSKYNTVNILHLGSFR